MVPTPARSRRRPSAVAAVAVAALVTVASAACKSDDDRSTSSSSTSSVPASTTTAAPGDTAAFDLDGVAPLRLDGSTYVVPDGAVGGGAIGTVVAAETQAPVDALGGAARVRFLYRSEDGRGGANVVSATLLVPPGDAPEDGWPVVSWAHGTTGVADRCAPSTTDNAFYNEYAQEIRTHLAAGYAVVATDYAGLGTPGPHSYLVGGDEGNAVVDAVTAARRLAPDLSSTWFAVGHSQGGQAVLFATRVADRDPALRLAGVVSMAPASGLQAALPAIIAGGLPADVAYGVYLLEGLSTVDPTVDVESLLGPEGTPRAGVFLREGCLLDALADLKGADITRVFSLDQVRAAELSARMAPIGNPDVAATVGPVLVVQGVDDHDVPVGLTDALVSNLQRLGSSVEYRRYDGRNHDTVLGPSVCDRLQWMADHGGTPATDCTPYETDMS